MPNDKVTIRVEDETVSGFDGVTIRQSMFNLCPAFNLTFLDVDGIEDLLNPLNKISVTIGDERVFTGYIDAINPQSDSGSDQVNVSGRAATADLVDCSYVGGRSRFNNKTLDQIATQLCSPFNVSVVVGGEVGAVFPKYSLDEGSTPAEAIGMLAPKRAVVPMTDPQGNLLLTNASTEKAADSLVYGDNILKYTGTIDYSERYSHYVVKGNSIGDDKGWRKVNVSTQEQAVDNKIGDKRYRSVLLNSSNESYIGDAKTQAAWMMAVRTGKSKTVAVTVSGWRQSTEDLWPVNRLVFVDIPRMRLKQDYLITEVEYSLTSEGRKATLILNDPVIFSADPSPVRKTDNLGWG